MANEFKDVGLATDKPKGFVKWSLIAYWTAIMSLCAYIVKLHVQKDRDQKECSNRVQQIMAQTSKAIDDIRVEYNNKLEERLNRMERVETKVENIQKSGRQ